MKLNKMARIYGSLLRNKIQWKVIKVKVKVKQSRYRPAVAQRVPGS